MHRHSIFTRHVSQSPSSSASLHVTTVPEATGFVFNRHDFNSSGLQLAANYANSMLLGAGDEQLVLKRKSDRWPVPTDDWQVQISWCYAVCHCCCVLHGWHPVLLTTQPQLSITLHQHLMYSTTATPADTCCLLRCNRRRYHHDHKYQGQPVLDAGAPAGCAHGPENHSEHKHDLKQSVHVLFISTTTMWWCPAQCRHGP